MDAGNTFAIVTAIAFLMVLPIALFLEGPMLQGAWEAAIKSGVYEETELLGRILASGLSFYLYNEACAREEPAPLVEMDAVPHLISTALARPPPTPRDLHRPIATSTVPTRPPSP